MANPFKKLVESLPDIASKASSSVQDSLASTGKKIGSASSNLVQNATDRFRGDDIEQIETECSVLTRYTNNEVIIHHKLQALTAAALAGGFIHFETPLMRATRPVMDTDSGFIQNVWRQVFPESDVTQAVNLFMDRVPGSSISGGFAHRIHHGHDLDALLEIMRDHNSEGAIQWFNHVWLRDFWTPSGVPYLPTGSSSVFDWLVGHDSITPSMAANILTINAAEFLAGAFAIRSIWTIHKILKENKNNKDIRELLDDGHRKDQLGDYQAATNAFKRAVRLSRDDLHLKLQIAAMRLNTAIADDSAESAVCATQGYRYAQEVLDASIIKPDDRIDFLGSTQISTRGYAGYLLVSAAPKALKDPSLRLEPAELRTAIDGFLRTAQTLDRISNNPANLWDRRLSASLNELLALELCTQLEKNENLDPLDIRKTLLNRLEHVAETSKDKSPLAKQLVRGIEAAYPISA